MKTSPRIYAKAFLSALGLGVSEELAIKRLKQSLVKRGEHARIVEVTEEVEKLMVNEKGGKVVVIEFARAQDAKARKNMLDLFDKKDRVITKINPRLVAGLRVLRDGEWEYDMSLNAKLEKILP
ncbi:MAG TPA: F0F1 ATP synthase subunit delta [Candidatus Paceibacterota bacterium]